MKIITKMVIIILIKMQKNNHTNDIDNEIVFTNFF